MKNYGVYHIFCVNNWKNVFLEQIDDLKNSGLIDFIDKLFLTIVYSDDNDIDFIKENCNIFYIHTKGVSITESNMRFYHNSSDINHLTECVNDWRKYMSYFIIKKYTDCLEILKSYDACGVNLCFNPQKHFSGNFWWATSTYINKLKDIETINKSHRWNAEFWIGSANGNLYSFHNNSAGYRQRIKKETYI